MGGLALKHLNVRRVPAAEYFDLTAMVKEIFQKVFGAELHIIPAYRQKADFGDCDAVVASNQLPEDWRERFSAVVGSRGMVRNGNVTSIEVNGVQFDFIVMPVYKVANAVAYFSYNDLGNLMGRIAHKMGFKYGHDGLWLVIRNKDHILAEIDTKATLPEIFGFLGYDYSRWHAGFDSLEEIFEFTASSPYFNPDIYLLHNRNAVSRVRDAKRKTYTQFLEWCAYKQFDGSRRMFYWPTGEAEAEQRDAIKERFRHNAFENWPHMADEWAEVQERARVNEILAQKFNGNICMEITGYTGKELGAFITHIKSLPEYQLFYSMDADNVRAFVKAIFDLEQAQ